MGCADAGLVVINIALMETLGNEMRSCDRNDHWNLLNYLLIMIITVPSSSHRVQM